MRTTRTYPSGAHCAACTAFLSYRCTHTRISVERAAWRPSPGGAWPSAASAAVHTSPYEAGVAELCAERQFFTGGVNREVKDTSGRRHAKGVEKANEQPPGSGFFVHAFLALSVLVNRNTTALF